MADDIGPGRLGDRLDGVDGDARRHDVFDQVQDAGILGEALADRRPQPELQDGAGLLVVPIPRASPRARRSSSNRARIVSISRSTASSSSGGITPGTMT
jgi:hypothetical protein